MRASLLAASLLVLGIAPGCIDIVAHVDPAPAARPPSLPDAPSPARASATVVAVDGQAVPLTFVREETSSDEFGRLTSALLFETLEDVHISDQPEEALVHRWFDAADGRSLHTTIDDNPVTVYWTDTGYGVFPDAWDAALFMFLIANPLQGHPLGTRVPIGAFQYTMSETGPGQGCTWHSITWSREGSPSSSGAARSCLAPGAALPLATEVATRHDAVKAVWTPDGFAPPQLHGAPLPPVSVGLEPWRAVTRGPVTVYVPPPSNRPSAGEDRFLAEAHGLLSDPKFLAALAGKPAPSLPFVWEIGCNPPCGTATSSSGTNVWLQAVSDDVWYWESLRAANTTLGETFVPASLGWDFGAQGSFFRHDPSRSLLAPVADLKARYADRVPAQIEWTAWEEMRSELVSSAWGASTMLFPPCAPTADGRVIWLSGINGQILADGHVTLRGSGCGAGTFDAYEAAGLVPRGTSARLASLTSVAHG